MDIINAITKEEGSLPGYEFYNLQTHVDIRGPKRGYFILRRLKLATYTFSCAKKHEYIQRTTQVACPVPIYNTFEDLIGELRPIEDVVAQEHPHRSSELERWRKIRRLHDFRQEEWIALFKGCIYTPQKAFEKGYMPHLKYPRVHAPGDLAPLLEEGHTILVDLINTPHHLRQVWKLDVVDERDPPKRFALWTL